MRGPLEELGPQVRGAAHARRAIAELAGFGLGAGNQLRHRLDAERRVDDQHDGLHRHHRAEFKALDAVIQRLLHQRRHDVAGGGAQQQGVAIGPGPRHETRADRRAASGLVLHHHRLAQPLFQRARQAARHHVGGAARRVRVDQRDGVLRIGSRHGGGRGHGGQGGYRRRKQGSDHRWHGRSSRRGKRGNGAGQRGRNQSARAPDCWMIRAHFRVSARMRSANSSGVLCVVWMP
ncbi:hypothetical protein D3C86_1403990 [compost metagenome]